MIEIHFYLYDVIASTGIILCMCPANERRRYNVTLSFIGWTHTKNDPCFNGLWDHVKSVPPSNISHHPLGGSVSPWWLAGAHCSVIPVHCVLEKPETNLQMSRFLELPSLMTSQDGFCSLRLRVTSCLSLSSARLSLRQYNCAVEGPRCVSQWK